MHGTQNKEKIKATAKKVKQVSVRMTKADKRAHKDTRKQRKNRDDWEE